MGLSKELTGTHCEKITIVQYMNINSKNPAVFMKLWLDEIITNNASRNFRSVTSVYNEILSIKNENILKR